MKNFETPNELTSDMRHKKLNLEAIAHEIEELSSILELIEANPKKTKSIYLEYKGEDEESLRQKMEEHIDHGPDPDDTEAIVDFFKNELADVKQEQKEKVVDTN